MQRSNSYKQFVIPSDLLDDIASRFLLDAPDTELSDPISLCFLTELAYWFYLDEYVEEDDSLNTLKFDPFAVQLLQHVNIKPQKGTVEDMLLDFREFKHRVPTYGALLLSTDMTHVLLVQGFWHRASWGFPKGKINVDEEPHECAIREVLEETGYDISSQMNQKNYIETTIGEQKVRLYIIPRVAMDTKFLPRTKGEIKEFKWFPIHQLPTHKNDRNMLRSTCSSNMFYMVIPFVKPLREWLALQVACDSSPNDRGGNTRESRRRHRSLNIDCYQKNFQNSPCPSADFMRNKSFSIGFSEQQLEMINSDRAHHTVDISPKKKEIKQKGKGKKSNHTDANDEHQQQQKFTFKSRGKSKSSQHSTPRGIPASDTFQSSGKNYKAVNGFRSYSWQNFRINKKAINEALDKVWSGVSL